MNSTETERDAILRIGDDGIVVSATDGAVSLFGGSDLEQIPLDTLLDRTDHRGLWKRVDEQTFEAEAFGVRREDQPLEIRLDPADPDDGTEHVGEKDSLLRIAADVGRADSEALDRTIVESLGRIGHLTRVDRAYLFMMVDEHHAQNTHEWTRRGIDPQIDRLEKVPRKAFEWFESRLREDGYLRVETLDDIPQSASSSRAALEEQGIFALLAVGIFEAGELLGFIGFDAVRREARWLQRSIERLEWIAGLFIQSLLRARTQRELVKSKELFDLVRTATDDIIYDWNLRKGTVFQAENLYKVLGYEPSTESADPEWWMGLIHPLDRDRINREIEDAIADPAVDLWSSEYRVRRADGEWAHLLDRACIVRDSAGNAVRSIGSVSDLTERVHAGEELGKQQELFHYVQLATNDMIWDIDLETGVAWRSEALVSMLGYQPDSDQNLEWWIEKIHPEDRDVSSKLHDLLSDPGHSFIEHTYRIRHRDESWVSVLDRGYIVRDEQGRATRMIGTATDLTERTRTMRRLEESEARFRAVVENVSDVIAVVDKHGIIVYQSPASSGVFGLSPMEMVGASTFDRVHPEDRPRVEKLFAQAIRNQVREARATFRYRHAAGHWLTLETVGANFLDRETIGGIVLVSRDITHRRQLDQQLERSTRLASLGHLASSVAHEFNNVLMGAQPFVEVIRKTSTQDRIRLAADRIGEAIERGKETSRSLLQFARPLSIALETVDLRVWIGSIEEEARRIARGEVQIRFKVADDPVVATADPSALHQTLLNLILNASEVLAKRDEGKVDVVVRGATTEDLDAGLISSAPQEFVVLSVSDNGPMLDSVAMQHIFEPMYRSNRAPRTGIGLTVVHQLTTAQGGQVRVDSTEERTTFHLFLRSSRNGQSPVRDEQHPPGAAETFSDLILLVEDNEIVASGIAAVLELEGQTVEIVATGAEAIVRLSEQRPSVLILDIGLPDMSGLEVYDAIADKHPDMPVIFSSGHGDQQQLKTYLEKPNVEFLLKPYDAQTLMSLVERLRK